MMEPTEPIILKAIAYEKHRPTWGMWSKATEFDINLVECGGQWTATCIVENCYVFHCENVDLSVITTPGTTTPSRKQVEALAFKRAVCMDINKKVMAVGIRIGVLEKYIFIDLKRDETKVDLLEAKCHDLQQRVNQLEKENAIAADRIKELEKMKNPRCWPWKRS